MNHIFDLRPHLSSTCVFKSRRVFLYGIYVSRVRFGATDTGRSCRGLAPIVAYRCRPYHHHDAPLMDNASSKLVLCGTSTRACGSARALSWRKGLGHSDDVQSDQTIKCNDATVTCMMYVRRSGAPTCFPRSWRVPARR